MPPPNISMPEATCEAPLCLRPTLNAKHLWMLMGGPKRFILIGPDQSRSTYVAQELPSASKVIVPDGSLPWANSARRTRSGSS